MKSIIRKDLDIIGIIIFKKLQRTNYKYYLKFVQAHFFETESIKYFRRKKCIVSLLFTQKIQKNATYY